jgi:RNA 2',3'-cyclic 3'-phosphodiesterase
MTNRCFVAVDVEGVELTEALIRAQKLVESTGADVKCVEPENIHITLKFLGEVSDEKIIQVSEVLRRIAFKPFTLRFQGVGVFPNLSRPNVVWVGVTGEVIKILGIYSELEINLKRLGFEPEQKPFQPHATMCRVKSGKNKAKLAEAVTSMKNKIFGELKVEHIKLKKSTLTNSGPIYSTLAESLSLE